MPESILETREREGTPVYLGLVLRLLVLDFIILAVQGSVMGHLQSDLIRCQLAPLAAVLVGFRLGAGSGAAHAFFLGWANGALFSEPTGIPGLVTMLLGALAGSMRHSFRVESRGVRVVMALVLLGVGTAVTALLTWALWRGVPPVLPLSVLACAVLAPAVDRLADLLVPES